MEYGLCSAQLACPLWIISDIFTMSAPCPDLTVFLYQRLRDYCIGMISSKWAAKGANVCGAGGAPPSTSDSWRTSDLPRGRTFGRSGPTHRETRRQGGKAFAQRI